MKKSSRAKSRQFLSGQRWLWVLIPLLLVGALVYMSYVVPTSPDINIIDTTKTGPIESRGILYKETAIGQAGAYLFYDELGNLAQLDTEANLDTLVGREVYLIGTITRASSSTTRSTLTPTSIIEVK